jgi:hypothetical protein
LDIPRCRQKAGGPTAGPAKGKKMILFFIISWTCMALIPTVAVAVRLIREDDGYFEMGNIAIVGAFFLLALLTWPVLLAGLLIYWIVLKIIN